LLPRIKSIISHELVFIFIAPVELPPNRSEPVKKHGSICRGKDDTFSKDLIRSQPRLKVPKIPILDLVGVILGQANCWTARNAH